MSKDCSGMLRSLSVDELNKPVNMGEGSFAEILNGRELPVRVTSGESVVASGISLFVKNLTPVKWSEEGRCYLVSTNGTPVGWSML